MANSRARKFTAAFVKAAAPIEGKQTEYQDEVQRGLCLRVMPSGVKSWTFRYRTIAGTRRRISIGVVDTVDLETARKKVRAHQANIDKGGDPAADLELSKLVAKQALNKETVAEIGEWYLQKCEAGTHRPNIKHPKRQGTIDLERHYFKARIVPKFGKVKLVDLSRHAIQSFVDDLARDLSLSAARHCRMVLLSIYAFAERQDITDKNPVRMVSVAGHASRERVLTDDELRTIWNALTPPVAIEGAAISASVAYSVLLALATLQRRGEVTGISLAEIDRDRKLWTIPGKRTKNHRTHVVPLSELALELIDKALSVRNHDSSFVFPSPRNADKPIMPNSMSKAFRRMRQAMSLEDIRPHDLRRTGATNLTSEGLGFPRFTVSKVLNHTSDTGGAAAVTSVYDQNEYLSEKRKALDAWATRLLEIVEGAQTADNIDGTVRPRAG